MVSHSHLSNGNSLSSDSHDTYAEYGVSPPTSNPGNDNSLVMLSSSVERRMDLDSSDNVPSVGDASSEGSFALEGNHSGLGAENVSQFFVLFVTSLKKIVWKLWKKERKTKTSSALLLQKVTPYKR